MNNHILIAIALCAALLLIVGMFVWKGKTQQRRKIQLLQDQLKNLALARQLDIDRSLQLDRRIIGLDSGRQQLLFVNISEKHGNIKESVDLQRVASCRIIKERQVSLGVPRKEKVDDQQLQKISLRLEYNDRNLQPLMIPFYTEAEDGVFRMMELSALATEWQQHIDNLLTISFLAKHK